MFWDRIGLRWPCDRKKSAGKSFPSIFSFGNFIHNFIWRNLFLFNIFGFARLTQNKCFFTLSALLTFSTPIPVKSFYVLTISLRGISERRLHRDLFGFLRKKNKIKLLEMPTKIIVKQCGKRRFYSRVLMNCTFGVDAARPALIIQHFVTLIPHRLPRRLFNFPFIKMTWRACWLTSRSRRVWDGFGASRSAILLMH